MITRAKEEKRALKLAIIATLALLIVFSVTAKAQTIGVPGTAAPVKAEQIGGTDGTNLQALKTDTSGNLLVTSASPDPCQKNTKVYGTFSGTANTRLITGTAAKKIYFCSFSVITAAATNIAIVSGTGSTCGTGTTAFLSGGITAATGWNFAANGGIALGNGTGALAQEANNADDVCVFVSAANQTNITYSYVVQ